MVKLRSGTVYIDKRLFNIKAIQFNELTNIIVDKYGDNLVKLADNASKNILKDFKNIIELNNSIKLHKGIKGGEFIINKGRKVYLNRSLGSYAKNQNIRKSIYEDIWLNISKFILNYKLQYGTIKKLIRLSDEEKKCLICYGLIETNSKLKICIQHNTNVKHIFHEECYKMSQSINNNYSGISNIVNNCPYCLQVTVDKDIYTCR